MDLYRLNREEIEYELRVRGYTNLSGETVMSMRRQLKDLMRDETFGNVPTDRSYNPDLDC